MRIYSDGLRTRQMEQDALDCLIISLKRFNDSFAPALWLKFRQEYEIENLDAVERNFRIDKVE